jgi:hypothetical protein
LIVPGTGTHNIDPPNAVTGYKENAADRFIDPSGVPCTSTDGCDLDGVDYPASFFPLGIIPGWCPGLSCDIGCTVTSLNVSGMRLMWIMLRFNMIQDYCTTFVGLVGGRWTVPGSLRATAVMH